MEELFYKYPEKLMRATGYVSPKTGELIELTANEKNIYVVMKKRNSFFEKHFDKQEYIAELTGVSLKQTGRILRRFIEEGVIIAHKGSSNQHKNWRYDDVKALNLYQTKVTGFGEVGVKETTVLGEIGDSFWKSEKKQDKKVSQWRGEKQPEKVTQQNYQPDPTSWFYDEQEPF